MPAVRLSRPYGATELLERVVVQAREQAIAAGLVDAYQMFVVPAVVGGGTRPAGQVRLNLALAEECRFGSGTVYLCYRPA
jgi:riboflavin biosynthesis pyrimidine reductase